MEEDKAFNVHTSTNIYHLTEPVASSGSLVKTIMCDIVRNYPTSFNLCRNCFQKIARFDTVTKISFSPWSWFRTALKYGKKIRIFFFKCILEFLQLVNFGARNCLLNLSFSVTVTNNNKMKMVRISCFLYSWPKFFE